jgi:hypothetical protein
VVFFTWELHASSSVVAVRSSRYVSLVILVVLYCLSVLQRVLLALGLSICFVACLSPRNFYRHQTPLKFSKSDVV